MKKKTKKALLEKFKIEKIEPGLTHTQIYFVNNGGGLLVPNECLEDTLEMLLPD